MEKPGWSEPPAETLEQTRVIREVHVLKSFLGLLSHRIVNHQWPPVNHWIWGSFGAWVHRHFLTWVCCRTVRTLYQNLWFWTFPCFESKVLPSNIRKQAIPKDESTTRNRPKSTAEPFRAKFNFPNVSENDGILQSGNSDSLVP